MRKAFLGLLKLILDIVSPFASIAIVVYLLLGHPESTQAVLDFNKWIIVEGVRLVFPGWATMVGAIVEVFLDKMLLYAEVQFVLLRLRRLCGV